MRKSLMLGCALSAALFIAAACDNLPGEPDDLPENALTEEEADELLTYIADLSFDGAADEAAKEDGGQQNALAPTDHGGLHVNREFHLERACLGTGTVVIDGDVAAARYAQEDRVVVDIEAEMTLTECAAIVRARSFTLDTDPSLTATGHFERVAGEFSGDQTVSIEGAFDWTQGDRGGSCTVDLDVTANVQEQQRTVAGTFCGTTFEVTDTWSLD